MGWTLELGKWGEYIAVAYLRRKGYIILERNYRTRNGEIDIVTRERRTFVFVEVKTAKSRSFGPPQCWVDSRKQTHLLRTAVAYMTEKGVGGANCRFDVIAIVLAEKRAKLTHIVDAFPA